MQSKIISQPEIRILQWGEDKRLDKMCSNFGKLAIFWILQAVWVWIVSLPVTLVNASDNNPSIQVVDIVGWIMWVVGFTVQATVDQQKLAFENSTDNRGSFLYAITESNTAPKLALLDSTSYSPFYLGLQLLDLQSVEWVVDKFLGREKHWLEMQQWCFEFEMIREHGRCSHGNLTVCGFAIDTSIRKALIDMYSKCGRIDFAREVFNRMPKRDIISWNAKIDGYGIHGLGREALLLFHDL
ncbi:hypothetical protein IFM89_010174 [Coptis chinensis]|uniref:Pentatricopeptide repeat-containing protein n=1 Tax=Coptis chinensis TaxID=261450 RepID=A0A835M292_9MAGN|nr:hypothetical protein IFM89_010174 [Coptis chinensis]